MTAPRDAAKAYLVYDDDCPMCRTWCRGAFPDGDGDVVLVDARQGGPLMDEITAAGLDIDRGMVLKVGDTLHYGPDAIHQATLRSRRSGAVGALNRLLFRSGRVARLVYPPCREARNLVLRLLGIPFVRNLERRP